MGYPPLDYLKDGVDQIPEELTSCPGHIWENCHTFILSSFCGIREKEAANVTEQDFLEYTLRRGFLMKERKKERRYVKWDKNLKKHIPEIAAILGYDDITVWMPYIISDLKDMIIGCLILDKWVCNKQVLRPDPTFTKYLCNTENLQIEKDTFENLPFNTFYIDLELCNKKNLFGDVLGVFVNVMSIPADKEVAVTLYLLRSGNITISQYLNFDMRECPCVFHTTMVDENQEIETVPAIVRQKGIPKTTAINPRLITTLVLQLITYMKVTKPDIEPSSEMKTTYRPGSIIKNKYSEIYKQDVGVRIGKTITAKIKAMNQEKEEQMRESALRGRKPPTPHFRRAHWHKYWTGKGRTVCELRWIEPVFVCGSYSSDSSTDVIIHNVKA